MDPENRRTIDAVSNIQIRALKVIEKHIPRIEKELTKEYHGLLEKRLTDIFNTAVKRFYDSYKPAYQRTYSMYDILEFGYDAEGMSYWFDPSKMRGRQEGNPSAGAAQFYQSESGLYDQVFRKGWHGGADKIDKSKVRDFGYGPHPNPGVPYWGAKRRSKKSVDDSGAISYSGGYWTWGRAAVITPADQLTPLQEFKLEESKLSNDKDIIDRLTSMAQEELNKIEWPDGWWWR